MSSLFNKLGGKESVHKAVSVFYSKVLADDRINHFFKSTDMEAQRKKQIKFLTFAFGGPNHYDGKNMRQAHSKLVDIGLNDEHFDAVKENLGKTLVELGVDQELIEEVANIAESTRSDVLGR